MKQCKASYYEAFCIELKRQMSVRLFCKHGMIRAHQGYEGESPAVQTHVGRVTAWLTAGLFARTTSTMPQPGLRSSTCQSLRLLAAHAADYRIRLRRPQVE